MNRVCSTTNLVLGRGSVDVKAGGIIRVGDMVNHVAGEDDFDKRKGVVVSVKRNRGRVMYKVAWGEDLRNWHYDVELERIGDV